MGKEALRIERANSQKVGVKKTEFGNINELHVSLAYFFIFSFHEDKLIVNREEITTRLGYLKSRLLLQASLPLVPEGAPYILDDI